MTLTYTRILSYPVLDCKVKKRLLFLSRQSAKNVQCTCTSICFSYIFLKCTAKPSQLTQWRKIQNEVTLFFAWSGVQDQRSLLAYRKACLQISKLFNKDKMMRSHFVFCLLWHSRLWSFQGKDTKLERFLAKNQLYSNEITKFWKLE